MAPLLPLLSPTELSYIHTSLSLHPPIRPDGRPPTTFRPLTAETNLLPSCNGSARLCYPDGSEAIVGVKAEVERTLNAADFGEGGWEGIHAGEERGGGEDEGRGVGEGGESKRGDGYEEGLKEGKASWIEITLDIPTQRDDEPIIVFLAAMLHEALVAGGNLQQSLLINRKWHWRLYIDILLLSPPTTYPLPLLSLTTHLALLSTLLPRPISAEEEDPLFDDDWDAAVPLYASASTSTSTTTLTTDPSSTAAAKPPITLLVIAVSDNIFFDPSASELAVADSVLAVSVTRGVGEGVRVVAIRTVETMARGVAGEGEAGWAGGGGDVGLGGKGGKEGGEEGVWRPPRGGMKRGLVSRLVKLVCENGGVGEEVLDGLEGLDGG